MQYKYGHFNSSGNEFIITNPETPRAFDNFLWNDSIFSNVQQTGVGYADYQIDATEGIQLLTGIGRVCDFDVFGRDLLMSRLIYIRDNDTGEYWNVGWEPVRKPYEKYECAQGLGYTTIRSAVDGIHSEFRIFVPDGKDPVELWTIKTINKSGRKRNLSLFVYVQFQFKFKWGFDSYGDMIYRSSVLNRELNAVVATKHPHRRPHNHLTGYLTADKTIDAYDGTRDAFVGVYGSLSEPKAVLNGCCSNTPGSSDATIGALQFNLPLEDGSEDMLSVVLGATDREEKIKTVKDKYFGNFDQYFSELCAKKAAQTATHFMKTPDEHFDRILNGWVKQAANYGATWCRWGWNGYRDIVQHGFGVAGIRPERTREILLEALRYQYQSGLALRGWNPVDEKAYSDSALWLVYTLTAYIKESGDTGILSAEVGYFDGGSATVLGHVEQALNFLESNKGAHGLLLIRFGDWNDSLTAVGKEGRGESVWLSIAYAEAMRQMAELAAFIGDSEKEKDFIRRRDSIAKAVNENAWDGQWYTRCFDDNENPIGSHTSKYGKMFMEPQCWALIAGIAGEERAETLIRSCNEMLGTDFGYMLLAPAFKEIDDNIGRISSMEPGICENGTIYSHLNIWMILGLLKYGMADRAYELFRKISPGYVKDDADLKQKCPPFMYANCYYGPEHKNNSFQMEFTWITGSVAWYNQVLLNHMLGARAEFDGLAVDPCIPHEWDGFTVDRHYRGSIYSITVKNPEHKQKGRIELTLDGQKLDGNKLPAFSDGKKHIVEAVMR